MVLPTIIFSRPRDPETNCPTALTILLASTNKPRLKHNNTTALPLTSCATPQHGGFNALLYLGYVSNRWLLGVQHG